MPIVMKTIPAGRFKAECLALLDEVASTGESLVVTKRGHPVARLVAIEPAPTLLGSVRFEVDGDELVEPLDEHWDAVAD